MNTNNTPNSTNGQYYATRTPAQGYVQGGHKATHESAPSPFAALCAQYGWQDPSTVRREALLADVAHIAGQLADLLAQLKTEDDQAVVQALWPVANTLREELYTVDAEYQVWLYERAMNAEYEETPF